MFSFPKLSMKSIFYPFCLIFAFALLSARTPLSDSHENILQERISPSGKETPRRAYATSTDSNDILSVNLKSGEMEKAFSLDFPAKILAFSPDGKEVYLADTMTGHLVKMDVASQKIERLNGPEGIPNRLVIGPDGQQGYATYEGSKEVLSLDFKNGSFAPVASFENCPHCITLAPSEKSLIVSFKESSDLSSLEIATSAVTPFALIDSSPDDLELSRDGQSLYLVKRGGEQIEVIDLATKSSHAIASGSTELVSGGYSAAFIANGQEGSLYLAKEQGAEIVDIHPKSQEVKTTVQFSKPISSIAFFPEPQLEASFRVNEPIAGEPVFFDASATKSQKQGRIQYEWDFGDGQAAFSEEPVIEHTYEASGNYVARLTATQQVEELQGTSLVGKSSEDHLTLVATAKEKLSVAANEMELNANACTITTTTVMQTPSPASSTYGQSVTLSATVAPSSASGTVSFYYGGTNLIGTGNLSGGSASISVNNLAANTYSLSATYNGDATYCTSTSTNSISLTVSQSTPTIGLVSNLNPSTYGDNVTFTCTVTNPNSFGFPTGTITFKDGATTIGTGTLSQASANSSTAAFTLNSLIAGSHTITAVYGGNANFIGVTSSPLTQTVNQATTTATILSLSQSPTEYGQPITLQAIIVGSPSSPAFSPGGTVSFYADGGTLLLTTPVLTPLPNTNTISTGPVVYTPPPI